MPAGATRLATTTLYENQAFSWGKAALALQFHLEVTQQGLERWFIGHACEIGATPGVSVAQLRADTAPWAPALAVQGPQCLRSWLQQWLSAAASPGEAGPALRL